MDIVSRFIELIAERLNAPETFTEAVARQVGEDIRREYGGDVFYVAQRDRVARNTRIRREAAQGASTRILAKRYRLSRRQINRILATSDDTGGQCTLYQTTNP